LRRLFTRRRLAGLYGVYLAVIVLSMTPFIAQEVADRLAGDNSASHFTFDRSVEEDGYSVVIRDPEYAGRIWVSFDPGTNRFTILSQNVKTLSIDIEWFLNNRGDLKFMDGTSDDYPGTITGNDAKLAIVERGSISAVVSSSDGIDTLTFKSIPLPYRIMVNGEKWHQDREYTLRWEESVTDITAHVPPGDSTEVLIEFQPPSGSIGIPIPAIGLVEDHAYMNRAVTFDATESTDDDSIEMYYWDFGDGTYLATDLPQTQHTFSQIGSHSVILTVKDSSGNIATTSMVVNVEEAPAGDSDDSDGDGYSDFEENHIFKTDPNDPNDNPENRNDGTYLSHKTANRQIRIIGPAGVEVTVTEPEIKPTIPDELGRGLNIYLDISVTGNMEGPITVFIDLSPQDVRDFNKGDLKIIHHNETTGIWEVLEDTEIITNPSGGFVLYASIDSFSIFSVAEVSGDYMPTSDDESDDSGTGDDDSSTMLVAAVVLVVVIILVLLLVLKKRGGDKKEESKQDPDGGMKGSGRKQFPGSPHHKPSAGGREGPGHRTSPAARGSGGSDPKKREVDSLLKRATSAYDRDDYQGAVDLYNRVLEIDPDNLDAKRERMKASIRLRLGDIYSESDGAEKGNVGFSAKRTSGGLVEQRRRP